MQMTRSDSLSGGITALLRVEGLAVFLASVLAYSELGDGWGIFALCFLIPDLSLFGYLAGPRIGALLYNSAHSYVGAVLCLAAGAYLAVPWLISAGIIWVSHIGFDRAMGYGLKYEKGFRHTHLGLIGRAKS